MKYAGFAEISRRSSVSKVTFPTFGDAREWRLSGGVSKLSEVGGVDGRELDGVVLPHPDALIAWTRVWNTWMRGLDISLERVWNLLAPWGSDGRGAGGRWHARLRRFPPFSSARLSPGAR